MSDLRKAKTPQAQRPSCILTMKIVHRDGEALDPSDVWEELLYLFKDHPHLDLEQCEIRPDKEGSSIHE